MFEMYEQNNSNHGLHFASVLVGVAAGIAGTILYAAYREKEFNQIVNKTREIGDKSTDYVGDVSHQIKDKANHLAETVRDKAVAVADKAESAVSSISKSVHDIAEKGQRALN